MKQIYFLQIPGRRFIYVVSMQGAFHIDSKMRGIFLKPTNQPQRMLVRVWIYHPGFQGQMKV